MHEILNISDNEISSLLSQQTISPQYPWATNDLQEIEKFFKFIILELERKSHVKSRVEWGHYGSGYASFVDAWLYRESADFDAKYRPTHGKSYAGLVVLLSRLSPYFVLLEGEKSWDGNGGSSYLPQFDAIDAFQTLSVAELAEQVQPILEGHGLIRLSHSMLDEPLNPKFHVPTVLTDRAFTLFDAFFYWED
ncbi:hypothetical protein [Massilia sp. YIM B04103]|uniref:hypothetical protein n=1 Tax=Massilia sp. YIM B04103 TaxID=2963106 RepID=UPI002109FAF5|nr:hypothetical protein [Massilia sp. YIM B04103]